MEEQCLLGQVFREPREVQRAPTSSLQRDLKSQETRSPPATSPCHRPTRCTGRGCAAPTFTGAGFAVDAGAVGDDTGEVGSPGADGAASGDQRPAPLTGVGVESMAGWLAARGVDDDEVVGADELEADGAQVCESFGLAGSAGLLDPSTVATSHLQSSPAGV